MQHAGSHDPDQAQKHPQYLELSKCPKFFFFFSRNINTMVYLAQAWDFWYILTIAAKRLFLREGSKFLRTCA